MTLRLRQATKNAPHPLRKEPKPREAAEPTFANRRRQQPFAFVLLAAASALLALQGATPAPAASLPGLAIATLNPSDDAFVDHGVPTDNLNNRLYPGGPYDDRMLLTDHYAVYGGEDSRYVLLKFTIDPALAMLLSGPATDTVEASLRLFIANAGCDPGPACAYDPVDGRYALLAVPNDAWNETAVTYANAPAAANHVSVLSYTGSDQNYTFDVSADVRAQLAAGDGAFSWKLRIEDPGVQKYNYVASRESDLPPLLTLSWRTGC